MHFWDQSITLDSIYLETDSTMLLRIRERNEKPFPNLDMFIPSMYVKNIDILPVLWGSNIQVQKIAILSPEASLSYLSRKDAVAEEPVSKFFEDIKDIFGFHVGELYVSNGDFSYQVKDQKLRLNIKDISFSLEDILLEQFSIPQSFLPSEDLSLLVEGNVMLKKGPYNLEVGKIVSSKKNFLAKNILIHTDTTESKRMKSISSYNVDIPAIYAELASKSSGNRILNFENIIVVEPDIFVDSYEENMFENKVKFLQLPKLLNPYLDKLSVQEISFMNGNVSYIHREKPYDTHYNASDFSLLFYDFMMEPDTGRDTSKVLFSQRVLLTINDTFSIAENKYAFKADKVNIDTENGFLAKGIRFLTLKAAGCKNINGLDYYHIEVPTVSAVIKDWSKLVHGKSIQVPAVHVSSPSIFINGSFEGKGGKSYTSTIYSYVEKYFPYVKVGQLDIDHGDLHLVLCNGKGQKEFIANNFFLTSSDILIDSAAAKDLNRILFAQEVSAGADKAVARTDAFVLRMHDVKATTETGLVAQNVDIKGKGNIGSDYHIEIPELSVSFSQWGRLQQGKSIYISEVLLKRPDIYVSALEQDAKSVKKGIINLDKALQDYIPSIRIKRSHIENGDLVYVHQEPSGITNFAVPDFDLTLYQTGIGSPYKNEKRILYSEDFSLHVKDTVTITENIYKLMVSELKATSFSGIVAEDVMVTTDSSAYVKALKTSSPTYYYTYTPKVSIRGIDWYSLVNGKGTRISKVKVVEPEISIVDVDEVHTPKEPLVKLHEQITPYLPWINVDTMNILNGSFEFSRIHSDNRSFYRAEKFDLLFNGILLDSIAATSPDRVLYSKNIELTASDLSASSREGFYLMETDSIKVRTGEGENIIYSLSYTPKDSISILRDDSIKQDDIVSLILPITLVCNFNWNDFFRKGKDLKASFVKTKGMQVRVLRDKSKTFEEKERLAPHERFKNLGIEVDVDSVNVEKGYISYTEIPGKDLEPGTIWFDSINAIISNFSNIRSQVMEDPITINMLGQIMGKGDVKLSMKFDLFSEKDAFTYNGEVGAMDLEALNPALEPMAFIRIESGVLNKMTLQVDANDDLASGKLLAYFENLKIDLLDKDAERDDKDILSFLANTFVINTDNEKGSSDFNPGEINLEREEKKNYINYFWKTFRQGIFSSLGVKKARKVKKRIKDIIPFL